MNKHLNIFKTYTNKHRGNFQLENDLTRALAITLQEDSLFFNEVLKNVFDGSNWYGKLFNSIESETTVSIDIQKRTSQISDFEHIYAISLSESKIGNFWNSSNNINYDPICDVLIKLNGVCLIIEAKRDNVDCTNQVYNQVLNIINKSNKKIVDLTEKEFGDSVTPFDLNWMNLMLIATRIFSFENSVGRPNKFLSDFISLIRSHNYNWLPELSINSLKC